MGQAMTARLTGLGAGNARGALLGAATITVVAVSLLLTLLGVTSAEVVATLLFLPVFAAGLLAGRTAGYATAGVATLLYLTLRSGDLSGAGIASAGVMALTRAAAYGVAGHVGGLARTLVGDSAPAAGRARGGAGARPRAGDSRAPAPVEWDEPWATHQRRSFGDDRTQPVMAAVGPPDEIASFEAREAGYGDGSMTMSGGWPPDPPREHAPGAATGSSARRGPARAGEGGPAGGAGWADPGDAGPAGWPGSEPGQPYDAPWGDDTRSAATDDWDAVQESWRRQNGLPPDEGETGARPAETHDDFWDDAPRNGRGGPRSDPWGTPPANGGGAPASDPWGTPPANGRFGRHPSDPWGTPPANGGAARHPSDPWGTPPANGAAPPDPWGTAGNGRGAASDPWGAPATGRAPASDPWGTPPASDPWGTPSAPPAPSGWEAPNPATQPPGPAAPWSGLSSDTWPPSGPAHQVWDDPGAGKVAPEPDPWDEPSAPADDRWADRSAPEAPGAGAAWGPPSASSVGPPSVGAAPSRGPAPAAPRSEQPDLPAVDPETGLWTAKFLRDRLSSERARSRRSGHPCSMVLVQVPDGPLAQLPYRRQVTLLRELGYQFVAGGVVDHLVHVPDQQQHWFAVILPDTDRSGAQVLERRLRLGIGGYLASRGLRLRDLESASLTAPDDDPAMEQIWEALIGPEGGDAGYG